MPKMVRLLRRPRIVVALAVVVVLAVGGGTWAATRSSSDAATQTTSVVDVSTQTIRQTVSATGTINPATESDLSFTVSGTVTSVPVTVGAKVAKGAVLATVGTADLQAAVDSAQATLEAADQQLSEAGSDSAQLASAQAQVAAAQDKLTTAQQSLAAASLTSPIAGTVAAVNLAVGDRVTGSGSGSGAGGSGSGASSGLANSGANSSGSGNGGSSSSAQIVVISTGSWIVDASVGSADLAELKKGLQVEITPSDTTTKVFGTVSSVGIVASSTSSGSATFPVVIAVTGSPSGLYAGGTADLTIIVKQLSDVLTVPTAAVHSDNGKTVVYQQVGGNQVSTPVTVGAVYGTSTQVTSGLKAGDKVVVTTFLPGGSRGGESGERTRTGTEGGRFGGGGAEGGNFPAGGFGSGGGFGGGGAFTRGGGGAP